MFRPLLISLPSLFLQCGALQRSSYWYCSILLTSDQPEENLLCFPPLLLFFPPLYNQSLVLTEGSFFSFSDSFTVSNIQHAGYKICCNMFLEKGESKEI